MFQRFFLVAASVFALASAAPVAEAHVAYVLPEGHGIGPAAMNWSFLLSPLQDPAMLVLMFGTTLLVAALVWFVPRVKATRALFVKIAHEAHEDRPLVPWMLRLGLGIALIGAGVQGHFVSPVIAAQGFETLQILVGFGLLAGFLVGPMAVLALILFVTAALWDPYVLGNAEIAASALALLLLADAKPGVDQLLGVSFVPSLKKWKEWAPTVLRVGVGGAMIFLAIYEKFFHASASAEVVLMHHLDQVVPVSANMWVLSAGLIETFVGVLLVIGAYTRLTSVVAIAVLTGSFFFFKEDVTAHVTLFATLSAIFVLGAGKGSVDAWMHAKKR